MTGPELRAFRKSLGLTAEQFARAVGIRNGRQIYAWESETALYAVPIPGPVVVIVELARTVPGVSERLQKRGKLP